MLMTAVVSDPAYRGAARESCDTFSGHTVPGNLLSLQSTESAEEPESPSPLGRATSSLKPGSHTGAEVKRLWYLLRPHEKHPTQPGIVYIAYAPNVSTVETLVALGYRVSSKQGSSPTALSSKCTLPRPWA